VTGDVQVLAALVNGAGEAGGGCHIFSGCGYPAPGLQNFDFQTIFQIGDFHFTKPILIAILCTIIVLVFFGAAFWRPKLVPRGVQNLAEIGILAVRDQILRPSLGRRGDSYLPFLVCLFFYIWVMNLMELIPFFQFPSMSRIGFVWPLVGFVYVLYWYLGFKNQGVWGYFRTMIPAGVPSFILPILVPIEFARFFIVQPFTLGVRLFANMFAGHLLLTIFYLATWYMLSLSIGLLYFVGSAFMVVFVFLLEFLIDLLQAFIFTTLTATYIADSLERAH
jgi:F-type H+-transporting ATPase subunit a